MRLWVELKDHVPNGQTITSQLRFNTFNTKQTYNKSMSGSKGVAAITWPSMEVGLQSFMSTYKNTYKNTYKHTLIALSEQVFLAAILKNKILILKNTESNELKIIALKIMVKV